MGIPLIERLNVGSIAVDNDAANASELPFTSDAVRGSASYGLC